MLVTYAATGTAHAASVGRKLTQLVKETNLRYSLIRLGKNAESVAFFGGERRKQAEIKRRLDDGLSTLINVIGLERNLGLLQTR